MELRDSTKELHHRAEKHPIGASMADGTISERWWADWINALLTVHMELDRYVPHSMRRCDELIKDLSEFSIIPNDNHAAVEYAKTLPDEHEREGAVYVFTGAHLMGGAVTDKALAGRLPCNHLRWNDRKQTLADWKPYRDKIELKESANRAFGAVNKILEEIYSKSPK
jgi:hypothetical protein